MPDPESVRIRHATRRDGRAVIAVIDRVYREHGDVMDLNGYDRDLVDLVMSYRERGGDFIVLECDGIVRGSHGCLPLDREERIATFRRLYLDAELRGRGYGRRLFDWTLDWARDREFRAVELWSDVRFTGSHSFFEQVYGFRRLGVRKATPENPYDEAHFRLDLIPGAGAGD